MTIQKPLLGVEAFRCPDLAILQKGICWFCQSFEQVPRFYCWILKHSNLRVTFFQWSLNEQTNAWVSAIRSYVNNILFWNSFNGRYDILIYSQYHSFPHMTFILTSQLSFLIHMYTSLGLDIPNWLSTVYLLTDLCMMSNIP